jgi:epoxyqueuosine reductase
MSILDNYKTSLHAFGVDAGFARVRIGGPLDPAFDGLGAPAMLLAALPYGKQGEEPEPLPAYAALIAPFARRNYYRETVARLQETAKRLRARYGGRRSDYRIFCNSRIPERRLAVEAGLGSLGRNGLVITEEAGSLCVIGAMTLPYPLGGAASVPVEPFPRCAACAPEWPPCAAACPTGALRGDGSLDRVRCIQWYASGGGEAVPPDVVRAWGRRLYGCTCCQDACIHNRRPIQGVVSERGALPAWLDARELLSMSDEAIKTRFKGTAMGLSWLGPNAIRRSATLALGRPWAP